MSKAPAKRKARGQKPGASDREKPRPSSRPPANDQRPPLGAAAIYNPHLLSKNELLALFHAREPLLERLLEGLRKAPAGGPPQHHLILGQRGMGKTMLLHRLAYAVEDDADLSLGWLALSFPEEQYNVASLADFWLNCADALSDRLEALGEADEADRVDDAIEAAHGPGGEVEAAAALAVLTGAARRFGKRLVLLIDNADLVFARVGEEDWALREALAAEPSLAFVGASAAGVESTYDYGRAFYDFFHIHELRGLSLDETRDLLLHYAGVWGDPAVEEIATNQTGRLKTLHLLTGGNPRTVVLLYQVFSRGIDGDVRSDLEQLLDHSTPLYKARLEALPPQAQQVVHAVAVHWDPISAGELAAGMGLDVNKVSAQLSRLVKEGVIEKVPYPPSTKTGFQIAERFFNIWYLMRASRRVRRRLIWLVEFLRMFYSQDELTDRALEVLTAADLPAEKRLRHAEFAFALARAVQASGLREALEDAGLKTLLRTESLRQRLHELVDLGGEDAGLADRTAYRERCRRIRERWLEVGAELGRSREEAQDFLAFPLISLEVFEHLAEIKQRDVIKAVFEILTVWESVKVGFQVNEEVNLIQKAVKDGFMEEWWDTIGARNTSIAYQSPALPWFAGIYALLADLMLVDPWLARVITMLLMATKATTAGNWPIAKEGLRAIFDDRETIRSVKHSGDVEERLERLMLRSALGFLEAASRQGRLKAAADLFVELGADGFGRPLDEALQAIREESSDRFARLAPEMRQPAQEIHARLLKAAAEGSEVPTEGS